MKMNANKPFGSGSLILAATVIAWPLAGSAAAGVVAWGVHDSYFDNWHNFIVEEAYAPAGANNAVAIATGERYSLTLTAEGRVAASGFFFRDYVLGLSVVGPAFVPDGLSNVVAIAGGGCHSLALTADGRVLAWAGSARPWVNLPQTNVPSALGNVLAIAAGGDHSLALTAQGCVVAWGDNAQGQTNVPSGLANVVAIAAGGYHSLALMTDGRVASWGSYGGTNVPSELSNVVAIAAGQNHSLALMDQGRVVAWGDNDYGYGETNVPVGLSNVVAIAAGGFNSLALTAQGRVVAWGDNRYGQTNVWGGLSNVVAIAAGGGYHSGHFLALIEPMSMPMPGLELAQDLSGLQLRGHGAPGISCQLLRASGLTGPWLPTQPVTFTNAVQLLRAQETSAPAQFFRLLRK